MKRAITAIFLLLTSGIAQPATPTETQDITHLLNRIGFGPRPGDVDRVAKLGIEKYIDEQLHPEKIGDGLEGRLDQFATLQLNVSEVLDRYPAPAAVARQLGIRNLQNADGSKSRQQVLAYYQEKGLQQPQRVLQELIAQKIVRAVYSEAQLQEAMTDFWFNHFNVDWSKGNDKWFTTDFEMNAIRPNALGKFKDLLMATAKSPAMMFYLDNFQSTSPDPRLAARLNPQAKRKPGINENYAREIMELHTLGVDGGYTQNDVQEVARAFTGWSIMTDAQNGGQAARLQNRAARLGVGVGATDAKKGDFVFRPFMHDEGEKTILGHRIKAGGGVEDGEQVIDILAHHPSTARFIATKLVRRFVSDDAPQALVDRVAATFTKTDGDIREMLRVIFLSPEFYAPEAMQAKTKSPFELAVSAIRALNGSTNGGPQLAKSIAGMGQPLYQYQPPTGFPDRAEQWMNNGALLERINFGIELTANRIPGARVELTGFEDAKAASLFLGSPEFQKR